MFLFFSTYGKIISFRLHNVACFTSLMAGLFCSTKESQTGLKPHEGV